MARGGVRTDHERGRGPLARRKTLAVSVAFHRALEEHLMHVAQHPLRRVEVRVQQHRRRLDLQRAGAY